MAIQWLLQETVLFVLSPYKLENKFVDFLVGLLKVYAFYLKLTTDTASTFHVLMLGLAILV